MQNRRGVIDLGSNTFHLLIVDQEGDDFQTVYRQRAFVGLAEKGIAVLSDAAMDRGAVALEQFKLSLDHYEVSQFSIIGTSALRSATNSCVFITRVKEELGLDIEIIDGKREADLIFKGVHRLIGDISGNHVIMDIGGGSIEFILVQNGEHIWSESYDLGVGVLYNYTSLSDAILEKEQNLLIDFLDSNLQSLIRRMEHVEVSTLIGASGSFEVVQTMNGYPVSPSSISEISLSQYHETAELIIRSTVAERNMMDGLPKSRAKLIVVAMILIDEAIKIIQPNKLLVSPYALKEGVLSEPS